MEKQNPLLPFAYNTSSSINELPLDTTPRDRSIIDENAISSYHTRKSRGPVLKVAPSLKRKMGESFNEKDDIKRRETEFESEITVVDEDGECVQNEGFALYEKTPISAPPSSPPLESQMISEFDFSTNTHANFTVPDSPNLHPSETNTHDYIRESSYSPNKSFSKLSQHQSLSSDADFGIDRFNRFKNPSINQCPSTDRDYEEKEEYEFQQKKILLKAKEIVLEAFENIQTTINLESMGLNDLPDEIKDFDKLVIFNSDPTTQLSYQLYLTNNRLKELPPSLFKFTKLNVLGLRQNKLTKIPPLIKKLKNLTDLSLGTNRLQYLPPQILDLPNLQTFRAGPNPFIKVPEDAIPIATSTFNIAKQKKFISILKYLNEFPPSSIPSLKVKCLDKIAKYDISYQETKHWKKFTPKMYHNLIIKSITRGQYEETCSECDNVVVEPIAEAFEWWDILQNKDVPIRREFCSGKCARKWELKIRSDIESNEY